MGRGTGHSKNMGVTAMFPMIVSSTDSVKGRIPAVFGSRKGGEDLPYGRSEPMPGSCKWYWNIRIQVLERDRLVFLASVLISRSTSSFAAFATWASAGTAKPNRTEIKTRCFIISPLPMNQSRPGWTVLSPVHEFSRQLSSWREPRFSPRSRISGPYRVPCGCFAGVSLKWQNW